MTVSHRRFVAAYFAIYTYSRGKMLMFQCGRLEIWPRSTVRGVTLGFTILTNEHKAFFISSRWETLIYTAVVQESNLLCSTTSRVLLHPHERGSPFLSLSKDDISPLKGRISSSILLVSRKAFRSFSPNEGSLRSRISSRICSPISIGAMERPKIGAHPTLRR
ncbi:hypothetical protein BDV98DRAFT_260981 [Pterulicium gracile]|uniref:Uncharacterized protein n=1 Tax=Pterulicium gracile TaxID=1884261 RepID=A0A5C3Q675_9AGAR|nr:hypothetical protein BDV98DRAFT_260981 [Pterula gracilis]